MAHRRLLFDSMLAPAFLTLLGCAAPGGVRTQDDGVATRAATSPAESAVEGAASCADGACLSWTEISAGTNHTCGIISSGAAFCWGGGGNGQLGNGGTGSRDVPTVVSGGHRWGSISAGNGYTCGVTTNGVGYCWGSGADGRLGTGETRNQSAPARVAGGHDWKDIFTGVMGDHTCGITTDDTAYCWGWGAQGELGNGSQIHQPSPVAVAGGLAWRQLGPATDSTCGVAADGGLYCWGVGPWSVPGGPGGRIPQPTPVPVGEGGTWTQVSAGVGYWCALDTDGRAHCWGAGAVGRLGTGTEANQAEPAPVAGGHTWTRLVAGVAHACALTRSGEAYCWGAGEAGQLGNGAGAGAAAPSPVAGGHAWKRITAGGWHACAITLEGLAYCWGEGRTGKLGTGGTGDANVPTQVRH